MDEHRDEPSLGLTEEEASRLERYGKLHADAQAVADEYKAIVDALMLKRLWARRSEMLKKRAELRQKQAISTAFLAQEPDQERCSFPKPAHAMVVERRYTIHELRNPPSPLPLPAKEELIKLYDFVRSINAFAFNLGLRRNEGIKALKELGIDIYEEVARDWERGVPIRELSRRHGVGRDAISRWIKRTGRDVDLPPGSSLAVM